MTKPSHDLEYDIVIPTVGRPSLHLLLDAIAQGSGPFPGRIVVVDDRPDGEAPLDLAPSPQIASLTRVIRSGGRGPATARNVGWRASAAAWIVFLDDDVVLSSDWASDLQFDLGQAPARIAGIQGTIEVPLPLHRNPTDWERNVAGLSSAQWATADMAYRRSVLELVGGFDERFTRAYREDADLALRVMDSGFGLRRGKRSVLHPPGPERFFGSLGRQRGNQDDAYMTLRHGRGWRQRSGAGRGRRRTHIVTTVVAAVAIGGLLGGRRRRLWELAWLVLTTLYAWSRLRRGSATMREIADMLATSVLIPPMATANWAYGWIRALRGVGRSMPGATRGDALTAPVEAVIFDRDGTLVTDVPYNGDPDAVRPVAGAKEVLDRMRRSGLKVGVITNQSGVGRGLITTEAAKLVNARIDDLLGPFDTWQMCPHRPEEACECRKPAPAMVLNGAAEMGVAPERCVVIGDIGSDIAAARTVGAGHIMVPTSATLSAEVVAAGTLAADLPTAYRMLTPFLPEPT